MLVIVGYGEMAKAIISGLKGKKEIMVVGRDEKKLQQISKEFNIQTKILKNFDLSNKDVILAVKPYALEDVANELCQEANTLISILAGVKIHRLKIIKAKNYVRAMPNIAAFKKASMTALTGDKEAKEKAEEIFNKIGKSIWLENEEKLDIATAIAGSGPAFLAMVAEALADGGVGCGLKREEAYTLVSGLFKSYAAISDELPSVIKDKVMSPAGTTAAGYRALEKNGTRSAFIEAVTKAYERTKR